ncbi:hypothetical protein L484_010197 [Morus notabilis]|uniref:Uncharacterized protein n=1 Tax=Morus notabilis TaxID=981085 RepID=W9R421_9ROSA|nr:hypothetical protein L484_010197 [Morus notabilis]
MEGGEQEEEAGKGVDFGEGEVVGWVVENNGAGIVKEDTGWEEEGEESKEGTLVALAKGKCVSLKMT